MRKRKEKKTSFSFSLLQIFPILMVVLLLPILVSLQEAKAADTTAATGTFKIKVIETTGTSEVVAGSETYKIGYSSKKNDGGAACSSGDTSACETEQDPLTNMTYTDVSAIGKYLLKFNEIKKNGEKATVKYIKVNQYSVSGELISNQQTELGLEIGIDLISGGSISVVFLVKSATAKTSKAMESVVGTSDTDTTDATSSTATDTGELLVQLWKITADGVVSRPATDYTLTTVVEGAEPTSVTISNSKRTFTGLAAGNYTVKVTSLKNKAGEEVTKNIVKNYSNPIKSYYLCESTAECGLGSKLSTAKVNTNVTIEIKQGKFAILEVMFSETGAAGTTSSDAGNLTIQPLPTAKGWSAWNSGMCCNESNCSSNIAAANLPSTISATAGLLSNSSSARVITIDYNLQTFKEEGVGSSASISEVAPSTLNPDTLSCMFSSAGCGTYRTYYGSTPEDFKSVFCGTPTKETIIAALGGSVPTEIYIGSYQPIDAQSSKNFIGYLIDGAHYITSGGFTQDNFCLFGRNDKQCAKGSGSEDSDNYRRNTYWGGNTSYEYATMNMLKAYNAAEAGNCFVTPYEKLSNFTLSNLNENTMTAETFFSFLTDNAPTAEQITERANGIDCFMNNVELDDTFYTNRVSTGGFTGKNYGYTISFTADKSILNCKETPKVTVKITKSHTSSPDKVQSVSLSGGTISPDKRTCTISEKDDCTWTITGTANSSNGSCNSDEKTTYFSVTATSSGFDTIAAMKAAGGTTCGVSYSSTANFSVIASTSSVSTSPALRSPGNIENDHGMADWYQSSK